MYVKICDVTVDFYRRIKVYYIKIFKIRSINKLRL